MGAMAQCSWMLLSLMSAVCEMVPCLVLLMVAYKCSWVLKSGKGQSLVLIATSGHTHEYF